MRAFILAGGGGTRLAPLPAKQFLALTGPETLIQQTARRLARYAPLTVIAHRDQSEQVAAQLPGVSMILEDAPRGTAAAASLAAQAEPGLVLLLPSDHVIADEGAFHQAVATARPLAERGFIVTFGIPATVPETGYGYIAHDGHTVTRFVEKPPVETARALIAGGALWNSGMFLFRGDIMLEELRGVAEGSLDRVVMEKTARAAVVPCDIGWSDIGSWPSLWRFTQSRRDLSPVEESWGRYTVFARGEGFQVKEIVINPLSHFPSRHRKHWIVMAGHARVICGDEVFDLDVNGSAEVASGARLENPGTEPLHIIEVG